jgi:hypothetical protein
MYTKEWVEKIMAQITELRKLAAVAEHIDVQIALLAYCDEIESKFNA